MKKRITALILLLCILLTASCGADETPKDTDTTDVGTDTTAPEEDVITPDIPDDLRFENRTWRVLATPDANLGPVIDDEYELSENADVLGQAQYYRIIETEERFGIDIELNYGVEHEIAPMAQASINSGSYDYDLIDDVAIWHLSPIYEGLYLPVNEMTYIDLDKPWWNRGYIESVSVNPDNPYILFGSINLKSVERSICTFVNMDMLEERKGMTAEDMYDLVLEGNWTLDKMIELTKGTYSDENGDTKPDPGDIHGITHSNFWELEEFFSFSVGLEFTGRDEDGYPTLALNNERSIALVDKLLELSRGEDAFSSVDQNASVALFASGHSLFYVNRFFTCIWGEMRETNMNYGIIPCPKFDETIDNYYGAVAGNTQWLMIPVNHPDVDFTSAVTEYYAYLGYKDVIPAYYDITLKFKYTRGDVDAASQMLDIIVENQRSDFMSVNSLGGMEDIFRNSLLKGENTFASFYASNEWMANVKLRQYIEALG